MNKRNSCFFGLIFSILLAVLVHGQELETAGRTFATDLSRAPWTKIVSKGPISAKIRKARLGSWGMLNAVRHADKLAKPLQLALKDVVRITIKEKGWFVDSPVNPGQYTLGLINEKKSVHWVLYDEEGKALGKRSLVIYRPSKSLPQIKVLSANNNYTLKFSCGGIVFRMRFVSVKEHDAITQSLNVAKSKRIRLHSDIKSVEFIKTILSQLESSMDAQLKIYGGKIPAGIFDLYLFRNKADYESMDDLVTDGEFAKTGGFTSRLTNRAYFNIILEPMAHRDGKTGFPLMARAAIIHEMNHLVAESLRPGAVGYWANWFAEGLAELGVELALDAIKPGDGKKFYRQYLGDANFHHSNGTLPTVTDWSGGMMNTNRSAFYTFSYLVCRKLYHNGDTIKELLSANDQVRATKSSERVLRHLLESKYGVLRNLFAQIQKDLANESRSPATIHGYSDHEGEQFRITAHNREDARVLLPFAHKTKDKFRVSVDFAYLSCENDQVDVYFGYHSGRHTDQFMKVAILPRHIELWHMVHGDWTRIDGRRFDKSLAIGDADDLIWHGAVVTYSHDKKSIRVDVNAKRWVRFDLDFVPPLLDGRLGVGTWGGAAWFKNPKFSETSESSK